MQLLVRTLGGRTRAVDAQAADTVADLKRALEQARAGAGGLGRALQGSAQGPPPAASRLAPPPPTARSLPPLRSLAQGPDGVPSRHTLLLAGGRLLDDGARLGASGLRPGSHVWQTGRLRGGKPVKARLGCCWLRTPPLARCRAASHLTMRGCCLVLHPPGPRRSRS